MPPCAAPLRIRQSDALVIGSINCEGLRVIDPAGFDGLITVTGGHPTITELTLTNIGLGGWPVSNIQASADGALRVTLRDPLSEALAHGGNTLAVGATLRTRSESGQEQDMVVAASDNEGVVLRPSGRRRGNGHARLHRADGSGRHAVFPLIGFAAPAEGLTIGTLHERSVFVRSAWPAAVRALRLMRGRATAAPRWPSLAWLTARAMGARGAARGGSWPMRAAAEWGSCGSSCPTISMSVNRSS
jgi:hypothetical protein